MNGITSLFVLALGLAELTFGIYIFYAFLPLWYGLFGAFLGVGISQVIFDQTAWLGQISSWLIIGGLAVVLALAGYGLEPYRRYLVGGIIGLTLGVLAGGALGLGVFFTALLAIAVGVLFSILTYSIYDVLIVLGSTVAGAAITLDGLFYLTRFDSFNRFSGDIMPFLLWAVLVTIGFALQSSEMMSRLRTHSTSFSGT